MRRQLARTGSVILRAVLVAGALAGPVGATPIWFTWDGSPPGTEPTIAYQSGSTVQQTILEVTLHGLYYEDVVRVGQVFRRVWFQPGDGEAPYRVVGRPELPPVVHTLGLLVGTSVGTPTVTPLDQMQLVGPMIYPYQGPENDHDGDPPPTFQWDQAFYQQSTLPYPTAQSEAIGSLGRWCGLALGGARTYPLRVVPATNTVTLTKKYRVTIAHPGTIQPETMTITKRQRFQYESLIQNFPTIAPYRPFHPNIYRADFLFVTAWWVGDEIDPLVDQKRARGYEVVVEQLSPGAGSEDIYEAVRNWWVTTPPGRDHYCILVGYDAVLPQGRDENGNRSDKVYACLDGTMQDGRPDPFPEVRLGRISVINDDELESRVRWILSYEEGFEADADWLDGALLVAHQEDHPGRYTAAQEAVAGAHYTIQPVFEKVYGGEGATNEDLDGALELGHAVVSYRGHGNRQVWSNWSANGEDFGYWDVWAVNNENRRPVVFGITCSTTDLEAGGSFAEDWINEAAAIAYYGASAVSDHDANNKLNRELFRQLYDGHAMVLGDLIALAEARTIAAYPSAGEENAWMYLLLGDPESEVWHISPAFLEMAGYAADILTGPQTIYVHVQDQNARASVPGAIVSLWQDGEVLENRYTDASGVAAIPIDPGSSGTLYVTAYTDLLPSGVARDSIRVLDPAGAADAPFPKELRLRLLSASPTAGAFEFELAAPRSVEACLRIYDAAGREVATLLDQEIVQAGTRRIRWNGTNAAGIRAATGVYWAELRAPGQAQKVRVLLLR